MLARLIYTSRAPAISRADIDAIVSCAKDFNQQHGITGALLYLDGTFLQYLEGTQPELQGLFDRISRDDRHREVAVVDFGPTLQRVFPNWSMRVVDWNDSTRDVLAVFMPRGAGSVGRLPSSDIAPMFRAVAATLN